MNGLTTKTARERLKQDGENELAAAAKRRPLRMFLGQFRDVMVLILLTATGISAFLGEITDAVTIILIVLLNAILGFLQEYRTERKIPYIVFGGKVLYRETDIEKLLTDNYRKAIP